MTDQISAIRTPPRGWSPLASLLGGRPLPALAARLGLWLARQKGGPLRLLKWVIAVRHEDVRAVFARDLDFLIAPINAERIGAVNGGRFVLGMDRCGGLALEREALYSALAALDLKALAADALADARALLPAPGSTFDAIADYARPVAAATANRLFGIAPADKALFAEVARAIFAHTFLNLSGDKAIEARALAAAPIMQGWFADEIARRRTSGNLGTDFMGQLLLQGLLDDEGVRRTLGGMLVGSIDTTTTVFAKVLIVALSDAALAARMAHDWRLGRDIYGLCLEALRRWPHNPVVLRQAATATSLAGVKIKAGARVFAWTQAAMLDPTAFPDPDRMLPDRPKTSYFHFGGGLHPCAGRAINSFQIPMLVGLLLDANVRRDGKLGWAGPFPDHLPVAV